MANGMFITLEGGEGAGKSTQRDRLAKRLEALNMTVVTTREPGGSPGAEMIRALLVEGDPGRWDPKTETLLHFAARSNHVSQTIQPALERGEWVISDRFADSTMAYQGVGQGVGREMVETLYGITVGDFKPDLTLILDLPVDIGLERATTRIMEQKSQDDITEDRYEKMSRAFHARLRDAFLEIAKSEPDRCVVIDASAPLSTVENEIWAAVSGKFGLSIR